MMHIHKRVCYETRCLEQLIDALTDARGMAVRAARRDGEDESCVDDGVDWTSLPTYGGEQPINTSGMWSWDATRLLVGTCLSDLRIINR